jgi:SEC-C motif-containing protein
MMCPCGSKKEYDECCELYIKGIKTPPTAELLMKSRYTAYTMGEVEYIIDSHDLETRSEINREDILNWSKSANWKKLEIIKTKLGKVRDKKGIVEFKAFYEQEENEQIHHEKSQFIKISGKWYYHGWAK